MRARFVVCASCLSLALSVFVTVTLLSLTNATTGDYVYTHSETEKETDCPGYYCGRVKLTSGNWSVCQACPRGHRVYGASICEPCSSTPSFYDCTYLLFMALLPLTLHWYNIDRQAGASVHAGVLLHHLVASLEALTAALLTLLFTPPAGRLEIRSCLVYSLSDWYTLFFNPAPGYGETLSCTQEAAYPFYSMVFVYYGLSLLIMLMLRPGLSVCSATAFSGSRGAICAAMYFFPALMLIHALLAGVLYAVFPYVVAVVSLVSVAWHLAHRPRQKTAPLLLDCVQNPRLAVIVLAHWLAHAFVVVALSGHLVQQRAWLSLGVSVLVVPAPTVFYVTTVRFTAPAAFAVPAPPLS